MYHIIGSTGRTGTNFIAGTLNRMPGVFAMHEGHELVGKQAKEVLPPINLENFAVYKDPNKGKNVAMSKRSSDIIQTIKEEKCVQFLVDIAYYNSMLGSAILAQDPSTKMIGIIRNCHDFVRSAAFIEGEDILAVGWPDPKKPLTPRESFIAMGRIRPLRKNNAHKPWKGWGTIERNIWLWKETNNHLLETYRQNPDQVKLLAFESLRKEPGAFWTEMLQHFGIPFSETVIGNLSLSKANKNKKATGYQISEFSTWTKTQRELLEEAQNFIDRKWENCRWTL